MPEASNIKFYRNAKDPNKVKITFISINEEMKKRHKTIGLYFYEFEVKEGTIETPFVHGSYDKHDQKYRQYFVFGFTHNLSENKLTNLLKFPGDILDEDLEEYLEGKCSKYEIKVDPSSWMKSGD